MSEQNALMKIDSTTTQALARISRLGEALTRAQSLTDVKLIMTEAKVFQLRAKEWKAGREIIIQGAEVQLLAELRAGWLAIKMAKQSEYKAMLTEASLTTDQVNRWRSEVERIGDTISTQDEEAIDSEIRKQLKKYIQAVRENPQGGVPNFQGLLEFLNGVSEKSSRDKRTERAKQFCSFLSVTDAEKHVKDWLSDPGYGKKEKADIAEMWDDILEQGTMFRGQRAQEAKKL